MDKINILLYRPPNAFNKIYYIDMILVSDCTELSINNISETSGMFIRYLRESCAIRHTYKKTYLRIINYCL